MADWAKNNPIDPKIPKTDLRHAIEQAKMLDAWNTAESERRNVVIQLLRNELDQDTDGPTNANPGPSKASTIDLVTDDDQVD